MLSFLWLLMGAILLGTAAGQAADDLFVGLFTTLGVVFVKQSIKIDFDEPQE